MSGEGLFKRASTDYSAFLSDRGKRRIEDVIIASSQQGGASILPENPVYFTEGAPNEATFPYEEVSIKTKDGTTLNLKSDSLRETLQYGPTKGINPLLKQVKSMMKKFHGISAWDERDLVFVSGAQDGLSRVFDMLLNPDDVFLTHEPFYSSIYTMTAPYAPKIIGVGIDEEGIIPEDLERTIQSLKGQNKQIIKCLYVNPAASNPSGINFSKERKKRIYEMACKHNFLILEDDPYYFLQFTGSKVDSFLSLDEDNRVLRFDSFSKILSSGIRLAFVCGPSLLIKKLEYHIQGSIACVPGLIQRMVSDLLEHWGEVGFLRQIEEVQRFYKEKRDTMLDCAKTYLTGLCEWNVPVGGMFLWIKVLGVEDTHDLAMVRGPKKGVFVLPGKFFMADNSKPCNFIRVAYAKPSKQDIERGIRILSELIMEEKKRMICQQ